ncbi:hypothetical protein M422DRAFT_272363 [Sphaerobolus stellatus SS14]|uniref:Uncharacterized protein n=1 Tax=Sphaerobolus stellatus (strain SS14) TaxID=990650 RepID=A0A0C9TBN7_SPHS4|nr:hypothetical protein M422DRAFT_272363 [Sphaerobolus stellatus SS14]
MSVKRCADDEDGIVSEQSPTKKSQARPTLVKPSVMTKIALTESKSTLPHQIKSIVSALNWEVQPSPLTLKMGGEMGLINTFDLGEWLKASPNKEHLTKFALYNGGPIKDSQPVWNLATIP